MKKVSGSFLSVLSLSIFVLLAFFPQSGYAAGQNTPASAQAATQETTSPAAAEKQDQVGKSDKKRTKHPILMYLPNRIFDLMDIFRVRVRVGPGISAGVRATTPVSVFVGFHRSVFAGLPGPRGKAKIPWPAGIENRGGAQVSVVDLSTKETYYDPLEIGLEAHPLIVGFNFGIGVFELLDFATGFLFIDLQRDDF
ncbi:MAG: hypothetical protein JW832_10255 [Deltaproteobacteria bacterium]|nr:hypothetical protein [Deltaproteobacteria bacterium]